MIYTIYPDTHADATYIGWIGEDAIFGYRDCTIREAATHLRQHIAELDDSDMGAEESWCVRPADHDSEEEPQGGPIYGPDGIRPAAAEEFDSEAAAPAEELGGAQ